MPDNPTDSKPPEGNPPEKTGKSSSYSPQGTAVATHDIRVEKHESPHQAILKPLKETATEETITIPLKAYKTLTSLGHLKILGLNWQRTSLQKSDALKLAKTLATDSVSKMVEERSSEIQGKAEAEKIVAINKALDDQKKKAAKKKKTKNLGTVFALVCAIPAVAAITWHIKPERTIAVAKATSTIVTAGKQQQLALTWSFDNTNKTIFWITSYADPRITEFLQNITLQKPGVSIIILSTADAYADMAAVGKNLNITTYGLSESLGPINWLVIDNTLILDATSRQGLGIITDAQKAADLMEWADKTLEPKATLLWRAQ